MNESDFHELRSAAVRRELSKPEHAAMEAWLVEHPEWRPVWEEDLRLTRALGTLGDKPVATNFVTQVMATVARECQPNVQPTRQSWWQTIRIPGYAWQAAAVLLIAACVTGFQVRQTRHRAELARSLEILPVAELANVEVWRDFELVNALPLATEPSVEELAQALQ